jgi:hypothetical protein
MNEDRLLFALKRLGDEELASASDRKIRSRLETAWTVRALTIGAPGGLRIRRFAPVLAALVLVAGFSGTALGASADSPLWDTRVALESAGAFLRLSNDDRVAYLLDLVQSRTEEAARQQAAGHPDAAAKARVAAAAAVVALDGNIPQIDTTLPIPSASPAPSAAASPSPSRSPSVSGSPAVVLLPSASPTRTVAPSPTPLRTETPHPMTPTPTTTRTAPPPTPSPTKQSVTIVGTVHDASGANVTNACISTSATPPTSTTACTIRTTNGSYGLAASMTTGTSYSITLYAYYTDPATGALSGGSATATMTAPTTVMPTITLTPKR